MSLESITSRRLLHQHIAMNHSQAPREVAWRLGALQAQDYYGSLWALGLRTGKTESEIIQAIAEQAIIRTWPQRGTLHFIPAEDALWLLSLSGERTLRSTRTRREQLGLDETKLALCETVLQKTLEREKLVPRPEVMETLEKAGISTEGGRGYHILFHLALRGVTYVGPMRAKQPTVGLLDYLVAPTPTLSREEGLAELTKRYFTSHGPATREDFMWWSSLTAADAKLGLAANEDVLCRETIESKDYWLPKNVETAQPAQDAFLLPGFDEYMLGYKDRSAALHADHAPRIVPGSNGMFLSTVVIHGQVVGSWKRRVQKNAVVLTITPFLKLTKADQKLLEVPAEQYGKFLGLSPEVEIE